jgi:hypothetical protein
MLTATVTIFSTIPKQNCPTGYAAIFMVREYDPTTRYKEFQWFSSKGKSHELTTNELRHQFALLAAASVILLAGNWSSFFMVPRG